MRKSMLVLALIALLLAACAPSPEPERRAITPFPTATIGRVVYGDLLPSGVSLIGQPELSAPSTVVAIAPPATATPDFSACPAANAEVALEDSPPANATVLIEEITRYLNLGGDAETLIDVLRNDWDVTPNDAIARADIDYTGEGRPDVLIPYVSPDGEAGIAVFGCRAGTVEVLFEAVSDTDQPPTVLAFLDVNRDRRNDLLLAIPSCPTAETCEYRTQLVTFSPERSRFVDLLPPNVTSTEPPQVLDFDNDEVSEIVVRLTSRGTAETGPLRTGSNIYDWNGAQYVLSIVELEPPRFKIQVLHEGDRALLRGDYAAAETIYRSAIDNTDLRFWFNDEPDVLQSYALYRLLQAQVVQASPLQTTTFQEIQRIYDDPERTPVYAQMARTFLETFQSTANVSSACEAVRTIIDGAPEALAQLNRYGSRSPSYTAQDLCPF
ncbi:MAG: hypothetical protein OZ933_09520 [Chloroflexota bacterium]|nr:hypothetical protein [Chloroflexota bacterium]